METNSSAWLDPAAQHAAERQRAARRAIEATVAALLAKVAHGEVIAIGGADEFNALSALLTASRAARDDFNAALTRSHNESEPS